MAASITNLLKTSFMSKDCQIRSDEINDILSRNPSWMVRSGSVIMLCMVLLLILGASVFRYPNIITAPIVITSENLPAQLVAKRSGRIQSIFKENGDTVKSGEVIAMLETPALYSDYVKAKEVCLNYTNLGYILPEKLMLGEVQGSYSAFMKSVKEFRSFVSLNYHRKMISAVLKENEARRSQLKRSVEREALAIEQMQLAENLYKRESALFENRTISRQDYDKSRSAFLEAKRALEAAREELERNRAEVLRGEQTVLNLEMEREETINRLDRVVGSDLSILQSKLAEWEQLNLFISPVDGNISFTSFWQENQNVTTGNVVFTVIPQNEKRISGKIYIPLAGAGKVREGQRVNVKLDNYPYMEYGMVEVKVESISLLPASIGSERAYIVGVSFPKGLITNYSNELQFGEEMHGTAEIVTDNLSLLKRVFYPLKHLLKSHF